MTGIHPEPGLPGLAGVLQRHRRVVGEQHRLLLEQDHHPLDQGAQGLTALNCPGFGGGSNP